MNSRELAEKILENVGGKENVISFLTCMTRLRLELKDRSKVDEDGIKNLDGVFGLINKENLQVVLGPGTVNKVGAEFSNITGLTQGLLDEENVEDLTRINKEKQKAKHDGGIQRLLKRISNIFIPLLPGIIAAGLINGVTGVINFTTGGSFTGQWWYEAIRTMGWGLFAFLPIFVGFNAAKEFGGSPILGGIAGSMSVAVPSMPLLMTMGESKAPILLPFTNAPFNPTAGGLLAALFMGIFFAFLEKRIRKFVPNILDTFLTPLLTVIIGSIAALIILQPLGAFVTQAIFKILDFVYNTLGVFGGYILSAGFLPLVSVGLHQALTPIHAMLNNPEGPTKGINYLLPILMMAGGGQVGAGFALYLKTTNEKLKQITRASLPVGILGIGEPMMYAVTLPLGKPFITACLGAGVGGVLATIFHLGAVTQGVSGLFGLLIVQPGNQLLYLVSMVGAYIGGFVLTYFFGIDHKRIDEIYGK